MNEAMPSLFLPMYNEKQELDEKEDFDPEEHKSRYKDALEALDSNMDIPEDEDKPIGMEDFLDIEPM